MSLIIVGIVFGGLCCFSSAKITIEKFDKDVLLQECVQEVVHSYFNLSDTIIYLNLDEQRQNVDFNSLPAIKMNNLDALKRFQHVKPHWYIIAMNEKKIAIVLLNIVITSNWNPEAKFVIVYRGNVKNLLYFLERFYVINVVILIERENIIEISTYFPYNGSRFNNEVIVGKCVDKHLEQYSSLFPRKLPNQWENVTVNVRFSYYAPYVIWGKNNSFTGVEIDLFNLVRNKIGFKVNALTTSELATCSKGTCNLDTKKVFHYKVEMYLGLYGKADAFRENSIPFLYDSYQWVVPVAELEITWYRLVNIFHYSVWLGLMAVVVIAPFIFHFMAFGASDVINYRRFPECLMVIIQCLIGHAVNVMPRTNSVRILFMAMLMFCCVIITAYQSRLLWDFYDDSKQISSVKEILESNLKIGFQATFDDYFKDDNEKMGINILKVKQDCRTLTCLNRTVVEKDSVTFDSKHYILYKNVNFLGENNQSQIYFLKDGTIQFPISIRFTKGFPLKDNINRIINELIEHGITHYLSDKLDFRSEKSIELALELQFAPHPMNMKKLQGAFWLLLCGWSVSLVALLCEILYSKYSISDLRKICTKINNRIKRKPKISTHRNTETFEWYQN